MKKLSLLFCFLNVPLYLNPNFVFAVGSGGYENQVPSARALGRANSVVASIDDASAVTFNPSRLTAINGGDMSLGLTYQKVSTKFEGSGVSDSTTADPAYSPNFHIAHRFGSEKWGFGLGVNVPFGLGNEWPHDGQIAPQATKSSLAVIDVNPAAAYKINDRLSLGFGLDFYAADVTLESNPGVDVSLEGDGSGVGANVGASYAINERHLLGLSYRTGTNLTVEGTLKIAGLPDENVEAELNIPPVLQMGYAFKPSEKWVFELDAQWDKWSIFDDQQVKNSDTNQPAIAPIARDWKDRWSIGLGTEFALRPNLFLRGGYSFWSTPIPNETFEPSTPDADTHGLTAGVGTFFKNNVTLDFAVGLYRLNDRHIVDSQVTPIPTPNGTYKTHAEYFSLNVGYRFGQS